jgi:hypothetical protein
MSFKSLTVTLLVAALLVPALAQAQDPDEPKLNVRLLVQPQIQLGDKMNPAGDGWGNDFFLRRARIILAGNVNKWIHFFYETDNPNFGKEGKFDTSLYTQDAYVDFQFMPELKVAVGLILLPFTHNSRQSAASQNTLDYHNFYTGKFIAEKGWRDMGVEARGIIVNKVDYRLGVYNGLRGTKCPPENPGCTILNEDDMPRFTGRVAFNLFDPEPDYFYSGILLGKKLASGELMKIASVGVGFDVQPGAVLDSKGNLKGYSAISGDLFLDYPLDANMEIVAQAAFLMYDRGYVPGKDAGTFVQDANSGMGYYGEIAFRYGMFAPVFSYESYDADNGETNDATNILGGVNMFIKGHNANVKLQYGRLDQAGDTKNVVTLQTQLLF